MESIKQIIDDELAVASQNIYKKVSEIFKNLNKPSFIVSINEIMEHPSIKNVDYYVSNCKNLIMKYNVKDMLDIGKCLLEKNFLLDASSRIGNLEMCKFLVENGANIDESFALPGCANEGYIDIVKYLFEKGADDKLSYSEQCGRNIILSCALRNSVYNGHTEIVKYLFEKGAYLNSTEILLISIERGHFEIFKYLLKKFSERGIEISDKVIDTKVNDFNKILFMHAKETQEKLFIPEIVELYKPIKSLMAN